LSIYTLFHHSLTHSFTSNNSTTTKPLLPSLTYRRHRHRQCRLQVKKNGGLKEQLEFSQSSKSSQGDYNSSTSTNDESNVSGSSFCNRPHMSKDFRWQAIRDAQMQHGVLGLRNFNLLKKLGCGDIGTAYLSELIGQNCLFAIKVMDNEFLAQRKKMPRAQTEREIFAIKVMVVADGDGGEFC